MHIVEAPGFVQLEDSLGTAIQVIVTGGLAPPSPNLAADAPRFIGAWKGERLEVKRENDRGSAMTETYSLQDKGRTLEVKTKVEGRRAFEFKRIYQRVGA